MPRPKSDITGAHTVGVRLSKEEYEIYKKLGGGVWLRTYLKDIAARRKEDAQANTATATGMVAVYPAKPKPVPKSTQTDRPFG